LDLSLERHCPTYAFSSYATSDSRNFKESRKNQNNVFKTLAKFALAGMKARWDECGGRILLDDDTGGYRGTSQKF
jgi:hypothetical protein